MTKLEKIRDELACDHSEACYFHLSFSATPTPNWVSYQAGFDAACAEWEKIVEPLVEALEIVLKMSGANGVGTAAHEALENYRKARE